MVGRTEKRSVCRTCGVHKSFVFKRGYNVGRLTVRKFVELINLDRLKACCNNDCAVFCVYIFVLCVIIYCLCLTDCRTKSAFARSHLNAVVRVDSRNLRNCLCKGDIYRTAVIHTEIKLVGHLFHRTFFGTQAAACTNILVDKSRLALDFYIEVADKALDLVNLTV